MRTVQTLLLAGAAMIVFAGFANAEIPSTHVLTIHLPGGGVEEIRYSGDIPPEIYFNPPAAEPPALFPAFEPEAAFAWLTQISEEMDRRATRLLQEAAAMTGRLPPDPDGLIEAGTSALPPGARAYTFVSSLSSNGLCAHSVEITASEYGEEPRVVSRSYGRCGRHPNETAPRSVSAPPKPRHSRETILVKAQTGRHAQTARRGLVQEAAWHP
jgi:hypothetical protein